MASTGKQQSTWETVGKTTKKTKTSSQNGMTKEQKKTMMDSMPRIDSLPPVEESSTIYDVFLQKEKSQHGKGDNKPQGQKAAVNGIPQKKSSQPQKGAKAAQSKNPVLLEDAVKNIPLSELQSILARVQDTFPENPSVWLKDLATFLNLKMDNVPEKDPVFSGKPHDYPVCLLPGPVRKMLQRTINKCSTQTLEHFLEHCVQAMVTDQSKSIPTHGYRMFFQLLLHDKPDIVMPHLSKYQALMKTIQNRPLRCLSVMWVLGQTGMKKLENGIKVWLEIMFPVLNVRALSTYAVEYLETLFKVHQNLKPAVHSMKVNDYFSVLDTIHISPPNFPIQLQKRILAIYPKIKSLVFSNNPETQLRKMFPLFLQRCVLEKHPSLQAEALTCLVECMAADPACLSEWRQIYNGTNLHQSGVLLQHLCNNWETVSKQLDKKVLRETIRSFDVTNEDMIAKSESSTPEGYKLCDTSCKELLAKMSRTRFPWRWLVFFLLSIFTGVIAYDIYSSQGFKKSRSHQLLSDSGTLVFLDQVWTRLKLYSGKALVWLQDNVPYYYTKMCEFVGPYLQLFWEKLYDLSVYIMEVTKPARAWLSEKIPQLMEWVETNIPWVWQNIVFYVSIVWGIVVQYTVWLWGHIVYYFNIASTWLLENVFTGSLSPENIMKTVSSALAALQIYMVRLTQYFYTLYTGTADTDTKQQ